MPADVAGAAAVGVCCIVWDRVVVSFRGSAAELSPPSSEEEAVVVPTVVVVMLVDDD